MPVRINDRVVIPDEEIAEQFVRSTGPGGQNVNKVSTAVELRFDVRRSASLPEDVRARLLTLARNRISRDGILLIEAHRHRTRERNRSDARNRLAIWIRRAATAPKTRRATKPTDASRRQRLESKRFLKIKKSRRRAARGSWE